MIKRKRSIPTLRRKSLNRVSDTDKVPDSLLSEPSNVCNYSELNSLVDIKVATSITWKRHSRTDVNLDLIKVPNQITTSWLDDKKSSLNAESKTSSDSESVLEDAIVYPVLDVSVKTINPISLKSSSDSTFESLNVQNHDRIDVRIGQTVTILDANNLAKGTFMVKRLDKDNKSYVLGKVPSVAFDINLHTSNIYLKALDVFIKFPHIMYIIFDKRLSPAMIKLLAARNILSACLVNTFALELQNLLPAKEQRTAKPIKTVKSNLLLSYSPPDVYGTSPSFNSLCELSKISPSKLEETATNVKCESRQTRTKSHDGMDEEVPVELNEFLRGHTASVNIATLLYNSESCQTFKQAFIQAILEKIITYKYSDLDKDDVLLDLLKYGIQFISNYAIPDELVILFKTLRLALNKYKISSYKISVSFFFIRIIAPALANATREDPMERTNNLQARSDGTTTKQHVRKKSVLDFSFAGITKNSFIFPKRKPKDSAQEESLAEHKFFGRKDTKTSTNTKSSVNLSVHKLITRPMERKSTGKISDELLVNVAGIKRDKSLDQLSQVLSDANPDITYNHSAPVSMERKSPHPIANMNSLEPNPSSSGSLQKSPLSSPVETLLSPDKSDSDSSSSLSPSKPISPNGSSLSANRMLRPDKSMKMGRKSLNQTISQDYTIRPDELPNLTNISPTSSKSANNLNFKTATDKKIATALKDKNVINCLLNLSKIYQNLANNKLPDITHKLYSITVKAECLKLEISHMIRRIILKLDIHTNNRKLAGNETLIVEMYSVYLIILEELLNCKELTERNEYYALVDSLGTIMDIDRIRTIENYLQQQVYNV